MDPLGLLLEVVALAVYPGGLFLAALAWITFRGAGLARDAPLDIRGLAAVVAAVVAAAMAPLPGTPAASLPPDGGATPNLIAAVLLIVVAGALVAPEPWSRRRRVLVAFGGIAIVLRSGVAGVARAVVVAASLEVVLAIVIPPGQQWPLAPIWVLGVVASTAVYALLLRFGRAITQGEAAPVVAIAWLCSVAASVVGVVAARP
jgi:hypothetical protein